MSGNYKRVSLEYRVAMGRAGRAVSNAVKYGRLPRITTQRCNNCGVPANVYHHHKGYAQQFWLDVIPLCHACHGVHHIDL